MAPTSPSSSLGKRTPSSRGDDDSADDERSSKRQRIETILPTIPPQEEEIKDLSVGVEPMFDDNLHQLLQRSIALELGHVGFSGATREAMESLCAQVDSYATHFLAKVTTAMNNSRRASPTPIDFEYALKAFDLPIASLEPHLHHPIPPSKTLVQLELAPAEELPTSSENLLLGQELSGEADKEQKAYIPKHFPSFPSKHTYKWTEKESIRETDPRKMREVAAQTARQGEEALRRLTNVGKAAKEKDVKQAASKDPRCKERHSIWEQAMGDLMAGRRNSAVVLSKEEDDRSSLINADRQFYRRAATGKRRSVPPVSEQVS